MALKDWKKIDDFNDEVLWQNKTTKNTLGIFKNGVSPFFDWLATINGKIYKQKFTKKSQALSFAKKYMRSH